MQRKLSLIFCYLFLLLLVSSCRAGCGCPMADSDIEIGISPATNPDFGSDLRSYNKIEAFASNSF